MTIPQRITKNTYESNLMPLVAEYGKNHAAQTNIAKLMEQQPDMFISQKKEQAVPNPTLFQVLKGSVPFYAFFGALEAKKLIGGFRPKQLLLHPLKWGKTAYLHILANAHKISKAAAAGEATLKFGDYMGKAFANFKGASTLGKTWNFLKLGGFKGWAIFGALFESISLIRTGLTHGFTSFNMVKQGAKSSVKIAASSAGWIGGAAAGAGIGAWVGGLAGSIFGPAGTIAGAAVGKFIGGAVGGITGNYYADKVAKSITGKDEYEKPVKLAA